MALAGGFLKEESFSSEKKYPMTLIYCKDCYMVQILEKIDPVESLHQENVKSNIYSLLQLLPDVQREVLMRRFGLCNHEKETLEVVGKAVNLTRERVRQIQLDGLKRLRALMIERGVTDNLLSDE